MQKLVVEDKRTKWQSVVDKCDHRTGISHLRRLTKDLRDKKLHNSSNMGVRFADKTHLDPKRIANKFIPPPICLACNKSKRQLKQQFRQLPLTGTLSFMPADTKEAIRYTKSSTVIGTDGMTTLHLKKHAHVTYLTNYLSH